MLYPSLYLWRTGCVVGTIVGCLSLISHQRCTALRTHLGKFHRLRPFLTAIHIYSHNLRDDLPTLFHIHIVMDMQVETADKVLVVQCGALHHRTRQLHRFHVGHRRHSSRSSHLECHVEQSRALSLCLKLICYCPSGALRRVSQLPLLCYRVHLQHYSVGGHGQVFPLRVPLVDKGINLFERPHLPHSLTDLESPLSCMLQIVVMTVRRQFGS